MENKITPPVRPDELIAQQALQRMGFADVVFEPNGKNKQPDFLLDGRIAVEVRRLNQIVYEDGEYWGLESRSNSFEDRMHKLLGAMEESSSESWFVNISFCRPVKAWRTFERKVKKALLAFKAQQVHADGVVFVEGNFSVDVTKASAVHPRFFLLGGVQDLDCGGAIVAEVIRNAKICSEIKLGSTAEHRSKYPQWWLLLVNQFGLKLDDLSKQQLQADFKCPEGWDKLVIVNVAPDDWIEFPAPSQ